MQLQTSSGKIKSSFQICREIDVSDITRKNYQGINYISWADAWARFKEHFPEGHFKVHDFGNDHVPYLKTELGYFVRVSVYLDHTLLSGETETLPVMGGDMKVVQTPDARDINDNIKRCLVKAMALHGFGLSVYEKDDVFAGAENKKSHSSVTINKNDSVPSANSLPLKDGEFRMSIPKNRHIGQSLDQMGYNSVYQDYIYWKDRTSKDPKGPGGAVKAFLENAKPWIETYRAAHSALKNTPHLTTTTYEREVEEQPPMDLSDIPF